MTALPFPEPVSEPDDHAAVLAAVPERRDFAFSADLRRVAWTCEDVIEWSDDDGRTVERLAVPGGLPEGTHLELIGDDLIGVCRSTDAGVELLTVATSGDHPDGRIRRVAALTTPRTNLLPRSPETSTQLMAVTDFKDATTLLRVD